MPIALPQQREAPPQIRFVSVQGAAIWTQALAAVEQQFGDLQSALFETEDAGLHDVAHYGFPVLRDRLGSELLDALTQADAVPSDHAAARTEVLKTLVKERATIASDALIALLERNPFKVAVPIRSTLNAALDQIEGALKD